MSDDNFSTKTELFNYLHDNNIDLLQVKRATKKSFCFTPSILVDDKHEQADKALTTSSSSDTDTVINRTIIGNTYNWLDSHGDVHVGSTFGKSIKERQNKIWHLHDHEYKITSKVGTPQRIYEQEVKWSDLGVDKKGSTVSLMMDTNIEYLKNEQVFNEYKNGNIDQHSVGMYYVNIFLAMDSDDKAHSEHKERYNKYIDTLGNKSEAEKKGYFYVVTEAKLIEISAVLEGSNSLTPTLGVKNTEPTIVTQEVQSTIVTDKNKGSSKGTVHFY